MKAELIPLWVQYIVSVAVILLVVVAVRLVERQLKLLQERRAIEEIEEEREEQQFRENRATAFCMPASRGSRRHDSMRTE